MIGDMQLADRLEQHEETSNAEMVRSIGGEVWTRSDALVFCSRPELGTGLNFACRLRSDRLGIEKLVGEAGAWLADRGLEPHIRVSPLTRPTDLAERLARRGWVETEAETQMVFAGLDAELPANPRVTVELVGLDALESWVDIQSHGFDMTGSLAIANELTRTSVVSGMGKPYVARLDGVAAGAGMLTEWAGVLGIYGVATLPEARRQGVGTALVRHLIKQAQRRGDLPLCLQAETGSEAQHWYERLGFRIVYNRTGWTLRRC